jgi:hypothetical protein
MGNRARKMGIEWKTGNPPKGLRLLLIAQPTGVEYDVADDNRPDLYVGHYSDAKDGFVPAVGRGMSANTPRRELRVFYWAEVDLPESVQLRALTPSDFRG